MTIRRYGVVRCVAKLGFAVLIFVPPAARSEIADSAPSGFTVRISATMHASPADVYSRIVRVGEWWSSQHTYSGDARNLSIDAHAGGCFCEKLPDGGSVQHMEVVQVRPGKLLRMYGGLGPLQGLAGAGPMTFDLKPEQGGTRLEFSYTVSGYLPQGLASWAGPVNDVLTMQIARLKNYVDAGNPAPQSAAQPKAEPKSR
jgi:uncharacterized protein YndB with AHSA1/START domain